MSIVMDSPAIGDRWSSMKASEPLHLETLDARNLPPYIIGGLNMTANPGFLIAMVVFLNIPGLIVGYVLAYQNQLTPCFEAKFQWKKGQDAAIHNALLGASVVLGMTVGALSGGILMKIGRRKSMFICLALGLIGNGLTIDIHSFWLINAGRFLFGVQAGLYSAIVPKMFAETIPQHLLPSVISSFVTAMTFSQLIIFLLGYILPSD